MLNFAIKRPESYKETKVRAQAFLDEIRAGFLPPVFAQIEEKAKNENLEGTVENLIGKQLW
jgi:hypothetical protein